MLTLHLPWPPSTNTYWRHPTKGPLAGRHLISENGREYRARVIAELGPRKPITGRLRIIIGAYPPDARRRDLDNILKSLLDALTHAQVIEDDSQFDQLALERRARIKGGQVTVTITVLAP